MGLYLAVFDDDKELDGVEVGKYDDFAFFRDSIVSRLEAGAAGSRFPTLIIHSDCDGEWTPLDARALEEELVTISKEFAEFPAISLDGWKAEVAKMCAIRPAKLGDCFFDIDGEPLLERLIGLAQLSQQRNLPILFQ